MDDTKTKNRKESRTLQNVLDLLVARRMYSKFISTDTTIAVPRQWELRLTRNG